MEITKTMKVSYPTVTYHSAEVFTAVKVSSESDLPLGADQWTAEQQYAHLSQLANQTMVNEFFNQYRAIQEQIVSKYSSTLYRMFDDQTELELIKQGRIKPNAK